MKTALNLPRDAQNRVVVDMYVKDDTEFLSKYSQKDAQVIAPDVADFLENSIDPIPPKEQLSLHVHSDCIDPAEQVAYTDGIHRYYADKLVAVKRESKRNVILAIVLAALGMAFIAVSLILGSMGRVIWTEAIDIVAWVFCWEAVDIFVFKNRGLKIDGLRYTALSTMPVTFHPITTPSDAKPV